MPIFFGKDLVNKLSEKVLGPAAIEQTKTGIRNVPIAGAGINAPLAAKDVQGTDQPKSTFLETLTANFKLYNSVFNIERKILDKIVEKDEEFDPNFRALENNGERIQGYEDFASSFIDAKSPDQVEKIKVQIDNLKEQERIISNAKGWHGVFGWVAAATLDPLMFIPAVGQITKITKVGKFAQGAVQGSLLATAGTGAAQGIEVLTQQTKSKKKALEYTVWAGMFGAAFGGVLGAMSSRGMQAARASFMEASRGAELKYTIDTPMGALTKPDASIAAKIADYENVEKGLKVGVGKFNTNEAESLARISEGAAKLISPVEFLRAPSLRGLLSPFTTMKQVTNRVFNHNYIIGKEVQGIARGPIAEDAIRVADTAIAKASKELNDSYLQYTGVGKVRSAFAKLRPEDKISYTEFKQRIARMVRSEVATDTIPEIEAIGMKYRARIDAQVAKLKAAGIGEDIDNIVGRNFFLRMYNKEALQDPLLRNASFQKIKQHIKFHDENDQLRKVVLSEKQATRVASDIMSRIRTDPTSQLTTSKMTEQLITKGKFTDRNISKMSDVQLSDILVNDIDQLFSTFMHKTNTAIEMKKALTDLGAESLPELKALLRAEKDKLLPGLNRQDAIKLERIFDKDSQLLEDMFRSMTGQLKHTGAGDQFFGALLDYNFVTMLGGVTLSSLSELAMTPFRLGVYDTLKNGYLPMIKSFKTAKLAKNDLADLGVAMELDMNSILKSFEMVDHNINASLSNFDRARMALTQGMAQASGIEWWTGVGRRIAGQVSSAKIIRIMKQYPDGLPDKKIMDFANLGIGTKEYSVLQKELHNVSEVKGSYIGNFEKWSSEDARQIMRKAIQTDVDSAIIIPGKGDIPIVVQKHAAAKVLFQFKSFLSTATGRIAISGLQRRDTNVLMGMVLLTTFGTLSNLTKDKVAGRENKDSIPELMTNGLIQSGALGLIGTVSLQSGLRLYENKYATSDYVAQQALGPSYSRIKDVTQAGINLTHGKISNNDIQSAVKLVPYNNLFYLQGLMNRAFPKKKRRGRRGR